MKSVDPIKILLMAETAEKIRHWQEMLRPVSDCIWVGFSEIPVDQRPDIILTDGTPVEQGDSGLVRIGGDGPADVSLPADTSTEHVQLICRMLAEIVRLRRRHRVISELHGHLHTAAHTDPLTGLANRRAWDQTVAQRVEAVTDSHCLILAIFDLDYFKPINDVYGHAAGDEVLKSVASALCENLRQEDFVARLGGDEFGLLIWVSDPAAASAVVDRVRAALPDRLTELGVQRVTTSAGLVVVSPKNNTIDPVELFVQADEALRRAKQEGRNRTVES
jgi:diguanylate cyclase (GGDEF)-like protein